MSFYSPPFQRLDPRVVYAFGSLSKQPVSQLFFFLTAAVRVCYLFKQSDFALNIATGLVSVPERRLVSDQRDFVVL